MLRFLDTKYISGTEPLKGFFGSTVLNDLNKSLAEQCQNYTHLGNLLYLTLFELFFDKY